MRSEEFEALLDLSAQIGRDSALVQAAGGNTSIKEGDTLWIKASGTWLAHARERNIMVPVNLEPLLDALSNDDAICEKAEVFVPSERNPSGLRPSIETTVHAVLPWNIVIHVHCVETIARACQSDAEVVFAEKLKGVPYVFIPYLRPGLPLAHKIEKLRKEDTCVLILGNHGLVVAADNVAEAAKLLREVQGRLTCKLRIAPSADLQALSRLAFNSQYRLPDDKRLHCIASDPKNCQMAANGNLYPDHVIFLGEQLCVAGPDEGAISIEDKLSTAGRTLPPLILFPGKGTLVKKDISPGALALAHCLADVVTRLPEDARLRYLTDRENAELLGWDAEKYRQQLNQQGLALQ
jgi:rhamnose utilization protein RhaD (predicted bifunctional aldolase and dehydrogenase)